MRGNDKRRVVTHTKAYDVSTMIDVLNLPRFAAFCSFYDYNNRYTHQGCGSALQHILDGCIYYDILMVKEPNKDETLTTNPQTKNPHERPSKRLINFLVRDL